MVGLLLCLYIIWCLEEINPALDAVTDLLGLFLPALHEGVHALEQRYRGRHAVLRVAIEADVVLLEVGVQHARVPSHLTGSFSADVIQSAVLRHGLLDHGPILVGHGLLQRLLVVVRNDGAPRHNLYI
jgi:hypothetical protein